MRAPCVPLWSMQRRGHFDGEEIEDPWGFPLMPWGDLPTANFRFALRGGSGHV